jgi:hypothetical protein
VYWNVLTGKIVCTEMPFIDGMCICYCDAHTQVSMLEASGIKFKVGYRGNGEGGVQRGWCAGRGEEAGRIERERERALPREKGRD